MGCLPNLVQLENNQRMYPLKLFRFLQAPRVMEQVEINVERIKSMFIQYMYIITNIYQLLKLIV
jgi:hypothetical protein